MAATANGAPDRRQETDRAIALTTHPPRRSAIWGQAQLNDGTTAAGAAHRRAPFTLIIADKVELLVDKHGRQAIYLFPAEHIRLIFRSAEMPL